MNWKLVWLQQTVLIALLNFFSPPALCHRSNDLFFVVSTHRNFFPSNFFHVRFRSWFSSYSAENVESFGTSWRERVCSVCSTAHAAHSRCIRCMSVFIHHCARCWQEEDKKNLSQCWTTGDAAQNNNKRKLQSDRRKINIVGMSRRNVCARDILQSADHMNARNALLVVSRKYSTNGEHTRTHTKSYCKQKNSCQEFRARLGSRFRWRTSHQSTWNRSMVQASCVKGSQMKHDVTEGYKSVTFYRQAENI